MSTAPDRHLVDKDDYRLDAYKRLLVHPVLHGEGSDTLVRVGRTVLTNANTEYIVLNADVPSPRYLHILSLTVTNTGNPGASGASPAYVQFTSKPSGAGTTVKDVVCPPGDTRHLTFGWSGLRITNNEHFAAKSDTAGLIVSAEGFAFDE